MGILSRFISKDQSKSKAQAEDKNSFDRIFQTLSAKPLNELIDIYIGRHSGTWLPETFDVCSKILLSNDCVSKAVGQIFPADLQ